MKQLKRYYPLSKAGKAVLIADRSIEMAGNELNSKHKLLKSDVQIILACQELQHHNRTGFFTRSGLMQYMIDTYNFKYPVPSKFYKKINRLIDLGYYDKISHKNKQTAIHYSLSFQAEYLIRRVSTHFNGMINFDIVK